MPVITKLAPGQSAGGGNSTGGGGPLSTRRGTMLAAGVVALLAGLVLLFALQQYRGSVVGEGEAAQVVTANALIPQGSSGDILPTEDLIEVTEVRSDQLEEGAITDPAILRGRVTAREVLPGQQLTAADFAPATGALQTQLAGGDRAVAIPVEGAAAVNGAVRAGDRVDVLAGFTTREEGGGTERPVVKTLMQNVLVLSAPGAAEDEEAAAAEGIVLRVGARSAADVAFAAQNGTIWLTLRPGAGAQDPEKEIVGLDSVLFDRPTIETGGGGDDE